MNSQQFGKIAVDAKGNVSIYFNDRIASLLGDRVRWSVVGGTVVLAPASAACIDTSAMIDTGSKTLRYKVAKALSRIGTGYGSHSFPSRGLDLSLAYRNGEPTVSFSFTSDIVPISDYRAMKNESGSLDLLMVEIRAMMEIAEQQGVTSWSLVDGVLRAEVKRWI